MKTGWPLYVPSGQHNRPTAVWSGRGRKRHTAGTGPQSSDWQWQTAALCELCRRSSASQRRSSQREWGDCRDTALDMECFHLPPEEKKNTTHYWLVLQENFGTFGAKQSDVTRVETYHTTWSAPCLCVCVPVQALAHKSRDLQSKLWLPCRVESCINIPNPWSLLQQRWCYHPAIAHWKKT